MTSNLHEHSMQQMPDGQNIKVPIIHKCLSLLVTKGINKKSHKFGDQIINDPRITNHIQLLLVLHVKETGLSIHQFNMLETNSRQKVQMFSMLHAFVIKAKISDFLFHSLGMYKLRSKGKKNVRSVKANHFKFSYTHYFAQMESIGDWIAYSKAEFACVTEKAFSFALLQHYQFKQPTDSKPKTVTLPHTLMFLPTLVQILF